jgi:hypothetical protein
MVTLAGNAATTDPAFGELDAMPEWAVAVDAVPRATAAASTMNARAIQADRAMLHDGVLITWQP